MSYRIVVVGILFVVNIIFMLGRVCIGRMNGSEYVMRNYLIEAKKESRGRE